MFHSCYPPGQCCTGVLCLIPFLYGLLHILTNHLVHYLNQLKFQNLLHLLMLHLIFSLHIQLLMLLNLTIYIIYNLD